MPIPITRHDRTVTARDSIGAILRTHVCRSVPCAVALEGKLTSDRAFAAEWAISGDPQPPRLTPYGLERTPAKPGPAPVVISQA